MVTFAQAQERAEEWINGDVPGYQHREVRVREFELGFVVWAEDRENGPVSDGGSQRLVIARDSGDATLWPGLPVGEVIRRYEEEYGAPDVAPEDAAPAPPERVDLNQTSFLLSPPEWLQEAADKLGIPDRRGESASAGGAAGGAASVGGASSASASAAAGGLSPADASNGGSGYGSPAPAPVSAAPEAPGGGTPWPAAAESDAPAGATPWAGTDTNADSGDDRSVPAPATVFAPPLVGGDDDDAPPPGVAPEAKTALMHGGSGLPSTTVAPALGGPKMPPPSSAGGAGAPDASAYGYPQGPG
ncbi:MAG: hypothetical protein WCD21_04300, partial [Streptomyces sp.]